MKKPVGLIYTDQYQKYNFGEGHPLSPLRIELTYELMKAYEMLSRPEVQLLTPRSATDQEVLRIHSQKYVNVLKDLNDIEHPSYRAMPEFGLGPGDNPIFPRMYDAAMAVCGASITAAEYILMEENTRSFNILGGLHHAMPDMASGFCLFNDVAVAIQYMLDQKPKAKIMYLDIDCHHGDGVQWIFYDNPQVLTLSFHQNGRSIFPGTGFLKETGRNSGKGYSLNFPFPPNTIDTVYYDAFSRIVPQVMKAYNPDYLVCQLGVDTHFSDPLTQMGLTTTAQEKMFKFIQENAEKYCNDKILALGGGGYNIHVVARSWSMFLAAMMGIQIDEPLPKSWLTKLSQTWNEQPPPTQLRDKNSYGEERQLKDPYFIDELEAECDKIVEKFESELIPNIK